MKTIKKYSNRTNCLNCKMSNYRKFKRVKLCIKLFTTSILDKIEC